MRMLNSVTLERMSPWHLIPPYVKPQRVWTIQSPVTQVFLSTSAEGEGAIELEDSLHTGSPH